MVYLESDDDEDKIDVSKSEISIEVDQKTYIEKLEKYAI